MGFFNPTAPSSPISSPTVSTNGIDEQPLFSSPRHSTALARSSLSKSTLEIPKPRAHEESPDVFLGRLEEAVSKAEIANVLAGNGDPFYTQALQAYIDRFDFTNNPVDIALRKLLMDVGLPKETQQIDRVMEAFATSYVKSNPGLFVSNDHPYILAFSLIMLHTDAFNRSNKRKMTKADYIKNTKLVGVPTEVLDYFFDNIVFAPFIFIEDPVDVNGQRGLTQDGKLHSSASGHATPTASGSGLSMLGKSNKVDPYYLITKDLLGPLRVDMERYIPLRNPFSYQGTAGSWNEGELRRSFARADVIEVDTVESRRISAMPFFSMTVTGAPGPILTNFASPAFSELEGFAEYSSLRVTKVGLLNRKEDLLDGNRRATNRKWKEWSVILTGSQLLFFRDSGVALGLIAQAQSPTENEMLPAQLSYFRPDELLSVKDAIAVYDSSYDKHENVLRLVMPSGRQFLLQAESELQRNEWIAHINYASAFKTAGIRMRPVSPMEDARMDASSYTHDATNIPAEYGNPGMDPVTIADGEDKDVAELAGESSNVTGIALRVHKSPREVSNTQSRSKIVLSKVHEFEIKIKTIQAQLDSNIRVVRSLAILTPFQRSTRNRLQTSVINLAKHIRQLRLEVVKTACHRDVLAADLASEKRELRRCRRDPQSKDSNLCRDDDGSIPRMTLSVHEDDPLQEGFGQSLSRSDISEVSHGRAESSICESFHSALDFGSDWPFSSYLSTGSQYRATQSFETSHSYASPLNELATSDFPPSSLTKGLQVYPHPPVAGSANIPDGDFFAQEGTPQLNSDGVGQELMDERAEEWDKTRAARRVSLVKVPLGLKVAVRSDKESLHQITQTVKGCDGGRLSECDSPLSVSRPSDLV
ncbi:hypothetical protein M0805_004811 [Coniferiporia weirii]|nr:hypothetical protein M0805_004811 [Coniferiporia weirii]